VVAEGTGLRCRSWSVQAAEAEGVLVLRADPAGDPARDSAAGSADGEELDGLRALCVAHWARHPEDGAPARVVAIGDRAANALRRWGLSQDE
jgi:hypothetical protein